MNSSAWRLRVVLTHRLGFARVYEAGSLDEAVDVLSEADGVDFALFDLSMPGMESAASLRAVRECHPDLRIAVVSASERRPDILLALASGVHGYVPKSLGAADLASALKQIWEGIIYVPPSLAEIESDEPLYLSVVAGGKQTVRPEALTPRQRDVLELLVQGKSNKEIARALSLGEGTVKVHMAALFRNLGAGSRSAAAVSGARLLASG